MLLNRNMEMTHRAGRCLWVVIQSTPQTEKSTEQLVWTETVSGFSCYSFFYAINNRFDSFSVPSLISPPEIRVYQSVFIKRLSNYSSESFRRAVSPQ